MNTIPAENAPGWSSTVSALLATVDLPVRPTDNRKDLERTIESAIVVCWDDLLPHGRDASVHIEYAFAPTGDLNRLEVWCSTAQGYWLLACTYLLPSTDAPGGAHFDNGYQSPKLAHMLDVVMRNQNAFTPLEVRPHGLLQVSEPNASKRVEAEAVLSTALAGIDIPRERVA